MTRVAFLLKAVRGDDAHRVSLNGLRIGAAAHLTSLDQSDGDLGGRNVNRSGSGNRCASPSEPRQRRYDQPLYQGADRTVIRVIDMRTKSQHA